jgi:hypothetical protein
MRRRDRGTYTLWKLEQLLLRINKIGYEPRRQHPSHTSAPPPAASKATYLSTCSIIPTIVVPILTLSLSLPTSLCLLTRPEGESAEPCRRFVDGRGGVLGRDEEGVTSPPVSRPPRLPTSWLTRSSTSRRAMLEGPG